MNSIETYADKSRELIVKHLDGDINGRDLLTMHHNLFYEIEKLYKQEIINANRDGVDMVVVNKQFLTGEEYYQKQKQKQLITQIMHEDDKNGLYENNLSDEDIFSYAERYRYTNGKLSFRDGAIWMREQLKQTTQDDYPELEGTNNLCQDIINKQKDNTMTQIEYLRKNVNDKKDTFLSNVNTLNYVIKLMNETPQAFSDDSLENAVNKLKLSYENYINSKIEFTEEYFKEEYFKNLK